MVVMCEAIAAQRPAAFASPNAPPRQSCPAVNVAEAVVVGAVAVPPVNVEPAAGVPGPPPLA